VSELVFDGAWDQAATWLTEPEGTRHTGQPPLRRSNRSAPASSPGN
jgi:hypothetical protein